MADNGIIRAYTPESFGACRELFIEVFNGEPWHDNWTDESAGACLREIVGHQRFFGFTLWEEDTLMGAALCHGKTWCKGSEVIVDELFISPDCRHRGYGTALMEAVEGYARENGLTSIALLTDREYPAFGFYKGQGYRESKYMVWIYRRME